MTSPSEGSGWALVTGAGRGIGRAAAAQLALRGLEVALLSRTQTDLEDVARAITSVGGRARAVPCDVSDAARVESVGRELVVALGAPRVVVNNAGVIRRALTHELSVADWDEMMGVNLRATFLVSRAFLPWMLEAHQGRIVNVASVSAVTGTALQSAYNAAKWGVVGFTKSLAEELRGTGVQTMALLPGAVDTAMLEGSRFPAQMTPETVAATLVYAALDAPEAMNGSAIEIFGP